METVLVTGASRGIGLGLTRRFLETERRVIATARQPERATELSSLSCSRLRVVALDVTDAESLAQLRFELSGEVIDILINNAGVSGGDQQGIENMDYSAWLHTFDVNTLGPFRVSIAFRSNLRRAERPRVVALSSQMGSLHRASLGSHAYRSSKAALNKVMQVLALELKSEGIVVCPVHPGWVRTDMGGPEGEISIEESAKGLVTFIDALTPAQTGRFWTWEGKEHPW